METKVETEGASLLEDGSCGVEEAVRFTGLSRAELYRAMARHELASFNAGRRRLIPRRALVHFLESVCGTSSTTWRSVAEVAAGLRREKDEAVAAEREACAQLADKWERDWPVPAMQIAVDIRGRAKEQP